ncbi:MAG: PLDc N-terminal domain-containing protein, partial [Alphaproteobacteria bacterium]|nr:PLDc N-terminal domain-containing protein [Alphaproteobacteria bacterium]
MGTLFWDIWPFLLALIQFGGMAGAAIHVMLTKTDERAAASWVGFVVLVPFVGWIVYLLFGVNRIQRRARELRGQKHDMLLLAPLPAKAEERAAEGVVRLRELEGLARFGQKILPESFAQGNAVGVLLNGDEAYPSMLEAISRAERSIAISTYIFNNDSVGRRFVDALSDAMDRGVRVRLLIDGVGSWYSRPSIIPLLEQRGIDYARFLHSFMPWQMPYLNMRNHQKIFVVDGRHGFTGGMNIAEGNLIEGNPRKPIHDCHFRVEGPAVSHLMHTFAYEW